MSVFDSALSLAAAIRRKEVSPLEAVDHYLARVDARNGELNAFVWRRDDDLRKEARAAGERLAKASSSDELPPFFGVPLPIKDLTEVLGEPVTHGSRVARSKIGRYDSTVIAQFRKAGFLFMGRTNSPEFGILPVTENKLYGATRNPWDLSRTPGGSSGGAAAAVAAGLAPIAHASDGGGSIRIPAACCGLVGLKPSRARVPKGPYVSEIMHGLSTDGCVSTTVADTAALLDAIAFRDPNAWYGVEKPAVPYLEASRRLPPRLRIAVARKGPIDVPTAPSCAAAVDHAATLLAEMGHEVVEKAPDWQGLSEQLAQDFFTIWVTSSAYMDFPDFSEAEDLSAGLHRLGMRQSTADYIKAVMRMQIFSRRVTASFGRDFDVLLTPSTAMEPPPIGWVYDTTETDPLRILWRCTEMVPFSSWCNVTGQPAISLPTQVAPSGLPVGVQLVAPPLREDLLLQLGQQLESALQWQRRLPVWNQ
jgi:amidase